MTLNEYLQQLIARAQDGRHTVWFTLTEVFGDPKVEQQGLVWVGTGSVALDAETLGGEITLSEVARTPSGGTQTRNVSLNTTTGWLTISTPPLGDFFADHVQLQYYNGVLFGTATHMVFTIDPPSIRTEPGPVVTLTALTVFTPG